MAADDPPILVGIVSDTHDNSDAVEFAVETFEDAGVEAVLHCGDFVAPFSVGPFDGPWDFHAVRGNNDGEWALREVVGGIGTYHDECAELTLDGTKVAVYHGTSGPLLDGLVDGGEYDYVVHGHTHEREREERAGTTRINPGGIPIAAAPDPFGVAILDTDTGRVETASLE